MGDITTADSGGYAVLVEITQSKGRRSNGCCCPIEVATAESELPRAGHHDVIQKCDGVTGNVRCFQGVDGIFQTTEFRCFSSHVGY